MLPRVKIYPEKFGDSMLTRDGMTPMEALLDEKDLLYRDYLSLLTHIIKIAEDLKKRAEQEKGSDYEYYSINEGLHEKSERLKFTSYKLGTICNLIRIHEE
tara:strand:- start:338 stop:640 length:303 start_codon:yes stop_codon:yes gene_type:complete